MTDLGTPPPLDADERPPRGRRRAVVAAVVAAVVVVVLVAGAGVFFLRRDDGPSHPKAWDPRIAPYVEIVEKQRGLEFDHPVAVRFLGAKAFEKTVRSDKADLDKKDRQEIAETTSLFRALGLLAGDVDLFDAINDATGSGTLAYYSFDDRRITVRGTKLSRAVRATLVHELTHALQDQRFGIADRLEKLSKKAEDGEPTTEADALQAIVEGDAERIAGLYRESLNTTERAALEKAEAGGQDAETAYEGVPKVVVALLSAPYALGQALTQAVAADDEDDLDALFEDPPPDDSVLIDPLKAIGVIEDPADVDIPSLATGEKKVDSGQIGALTTYLMLAERIPLRDALAAADLWRGDAYVGFERKGVVCARVDYATTTDAGAATLTTAFDAWIAKAPGDAATVERHGEVVTFESCDPGKAATLKNDAASDALELVATRAYLGSSFVQSGAGAGVARCLARDLVAEYSVEQLTDPSFGADDPGVQKRIQQLAAACR